ncbi:NfeD family protein [Sulfurovum sp.]|uniref:NfeD family protein n=1 Tax=Sulfurovum sp. TaxID=1969726 RepID=UPI0025FBDD8E|nr:NfeD family protein [Sulfurovum sp.]
MIVFLNETVLWWHWVVLGIILLILEMNSGTFILLGLGIAAVFVGVVDSIMGTSFTTELSMWTVLSVLSIAAWFKWFREPSVSDTGQSNYTLDTLGTVTEEIHPHDRGKVIFDTPVLGNTSWHATAKKTIPEGSRVKIIEVNGQLIEVQKA